MLSDLNVEILPEEAGRRLDQVLPARFPSSTRAFCRQAIAEGAVTLNGHPVPKGMKVRTGMRIRVTALKEAADLRVFPNPHIRPVILFEDDALIGVNKPAGLPVQPLSPDETDTLMNGLVARYPELAAVGDQPLMAGALHRIDTGTSGLVLAARTETAFTRVREQFAARQVTKVYHALVEGQIAVGNRLVNDLAHLPHSAVCKMVDARILSKPDRVMRAETAYRPIAWLGRSTLLEVTIQTGVTHQIRAQLALAGYPIVNDTLYGAKPVAGCGRHFLHAYAIAFEHPTRHQPFRLEAPYTPDFEERLKG
ncbi:MAG: RluA family pseudouridine synthase [Kiritimatiellae bacterium]|nr:RluA family pseudouridine synthase [Kiritimatiellia bacterium]MBP5227028.1 RluA family pseudouridine synthase [Kiritimatiellia bacterium]